MGQRALVVVLVVMALAAGGAVGVWAGSRGVMGFHPPTMTADGAAGEQVITLESGGVSYGVKGSVAWTDVSGSFHSDGWPDCLPLGVEVKQIAFTGGWVWSGDVGEARILWIDCRGH